MPLIDQDYMERYQANLDNAIREYVAKHSKTKIVDQEDVVIEDIEDGQTLVWDALQEKFINGEGSGGGGGTTDYNGLKNKPKMNGVEIKGDKSADDFKIIRDLTQAEYDALPTEEKLNGTIYCITDGTSGGGGSGSVSRLADIGDVILTNLLNGQTIVWDATAQKWKNANASGSGSANGYGICTTAKTTTQKVATLADFTLVKSVLVSIKFTNDVPLNSTLNINNSGAKPIYYRGSAIADDVIKAGNTATFIYDGTNYNLIGLDVVISPSKGLILNGTTLKPNLKSESLSNLHTANRTAIENREYPVGLDADGKLSVNVPWTTSGATYLKQTLTAGSTSVTFTNDSIMADSIVDVYTNMVGLDYTSIQYSSGSLTLTYPVQSANVDIVLEVRNGVLQE